MTWKLTVSAKGQVTIPKELRERLSLLPGDELVAVLEADQLLLTPKNIDFNDLAGLLGQPPKGRASLEDIDTTVARAAGENVVASDGRNSEAAE